MIEISNTKKNLYKEACPVIVQSGTLFSENAEKGEAYSALLCFKSISPLPISSMLIDLHVFDIANTEIEVVRDFLYSPEEAARNDEFGKEISIPISNAAAKTMSVAIRRVTFTDDSIWEGSASLLFESIPALVTIESELEDAETIAQFRRDFATTIAKNAEILPLYVPFKYKDLWFCCCGGINLATEEICFLCGSSFEPQKEHINNRIQLAENLASHQAEIARKAEFQRIEAERLASLAAAAKAWEEKQAEQAKERQEARKKQLKKVGIIAASITIPLIIAFVIFLIVRQNYLIPQEKYNAAKALLESSSYDEAITAFSAMEGYSNSADLITEAKYQKAEKVMASGDYDEAIKQYLAIEKLKDVAPRIQEANYQKALKVYKTKKWSDALNKFKGLEEYKDTSDLISNCNLNLAKQHAQKKELALAKGYFKELSGENSVAVQKIFLKNGTELYNKGEEKNATEYFTLVTEPTLKATIDKVYYDKAQKLLAAGSYTESSAIFNSIKEYKDSKTKLLSIFYLRGEEKLNEGDYAAAINLYKKAGSYEDAKTKINECNYLLAGIMLNNGDYTGATKAYKALGKYKDSSTMLTEITYRIGNEQLQNGNVTEAYNTLYSIKGYGPAYNLLISNSQFYIYIYDTGNGPNPLDEG